MFDQILKKLPEVSGLRVLMYHKIDSVNFDVLTIKESHFYDQMLYLINEGYQFLTLKDLHEKMAEKKIPRHSVMITFDDGYLSNYDLAVPILERLKLKANFFIPVSFIGKTNTWDKTDEPLMDFKTLKKLSHNFCLGLHSYAHQNLSELKVSEIKEDLLKCESILMENEIPFEKSLAYPYGKMPLEHWNKFEDLMIELRYKSAFRIGNLVNTNLSNIYQMKRIDIQGTESFNQFKFKIKFGRYKF